ncbi:MAG: hypothetical protein AB8G05_27155 [Oligoflexales bacterium]
MGFLTSLKFYTLFLTLLTQVPTYEGRINDSFKNNVDDPPCCLCEDCDMPIHGELLINTNGLTCAQLDEMLTTSLTMTESCTPLQRDFRPSCCDPKTTVETIKQASTPLPSTNSTIDLLAEAKDFFEVLRLTNAQKEQIELTYQNELSQNLDDLLSLAPTKEAINRLKTNQNIVFEGIYDALTPNQKEVFKSHYSDFVKEFNNASGGETEGIQDEFICLFLCPFTCFGDFLPEGCCPKCDDVFSNPVP